MIVASEVGRGARVFLVDDDDAVRVALNRLLSSAGFAVVPCATAEELLSDPRVQDGGCIILDLRLPGRDGLEVQSDLARRGVTLPVIFLTAHGDVSASVRALKSGALDFLEKPVDGDVLISAVASALERDAQSRAAATSLQHLRDLVATLSRREHEVFVGVAAGKLNKHIAAALGITETTVKFHRHRTMQKLGVDSSAQLARIAEQLGIGV